MARPTGAVAYQGTVSWYYRTGRTTLTPLLLSAPSRIGPVSLASVSHRKEHPTTIDHAGYSPRFTQMAVPGCDGGNVARYHAKRCPFRREAAQSIAATSRHAGRHKKKSGPLILSSPDADRQLGPPNRPLRLERTGTRQR